MNFFSRSLKGITKNVVGISLVSFFNDIASEMVYPIVPIFLTSVIGAPVAIVGLIEGIAESTAAVLRVLSGWLSDKFQKRKPFMLLGYTLSTLSKLIMAVAYHWSVVLTGRFVDRFGKGIRTSARDALLAEGCDTACRGRVFGFHRAVDTMGALAGPMLALFLLSHFRDNLRLVFILAIVPGVIGLIFLSMFVKDVYRAGMDVKRPRLRFRDIRMGRDFKLFFIVSGIFALGNSSDAFLILKARSIGFSVASAIVLYAIFNAAYALSSFPAGIISDRIGQKKILLTGFFLFSVIYLLFGFVQKPTYMWMLFPAYGIYMALTEGIGKAYLSRVVDRAYTGTMYGLYQTLTGIMTFFSSLIAGILWDTLGPQYCFIFGSATAMAAFLIFLLFSGRKN
jgi:MFS family permease